MNKKIDIQQRLAEKTAYYQALRAEAAAKPLPETKKAPEETPKAPKATIQPMRASSNYYIQMIKDWVPSIPEMAENIGSIFPLPVQQNVIEKLCNFTCVSVDAVDDLLHSHMIWLWLTFQMTARFSGFPLSFTIPLMIFVQIALWFRTQVNFFYQGKENYTFIYSNWISTRLPVNCVVNFLGELPSKWYFAPIAQLPSETPSVYHKLPYLLYFTSLNLLLIESGYLWHDTVNYWYLWPLNALSLGIIKYTPNEFQAYLNTYTVGILFSFLYPSSTSAILVTILMLSVLFVLHADEEDYNSLALPFLVSYFGAMATYGWTNERWQSAGATFTAVFLINVAWSLLMGIWILLKSDIIPIDSIMELKPMCTVFLFAICIQQPFLALVLCIASIYYVFQHLPTNFSKGK